MYVNFGLFWKAEYLSLFKSRFSVRRWAFVLFFTALYWCMWLIVAFGWTLDYLLFPGLRKQQVKRAPSSSLRRPAAGRP